MRERNLALADLTSRAIVASPCGDRARRRFSCANGTWRCLDGLSLAPEDDRLDHMRALDELETVRTVWEFPISVVDFALT